MSRLLEDRDRNIIPRWRDFRTTVALGQLGPVRKDFVSGYVADEGFEKKLREWKVLGGVTLACELVGAAAVLGRQAEVGEAAEFLLETSSDVPSAARNLARKILFLGAEDDLVEPSAVTEDQSEHRAAVHRLRKLSRAEPRDSILNVDLALEYALLGLPEKARKAMEMAVRLAPDNRFVLRSACRLYLHLGKTEKAHRVLVSSGRTERDPWLMSAEIAVAAVAERTSRLIKRAREILASDSYAPLALTELASALATLELRDGNDRAARKLFRQALQSPTENSVAQAGWAKRTVGLDANIMEFDVPLVYEARTWAYYMGSKWRESFRMAKKWFDDQPFSGWSARVASHIALTPLEDYARAISICQLALVASPEDGGITNNLAFALANMGRVEEADNLIGQVNLTGEEPGVQVALAATRGFIAYRLGRLEEGRRRYQDAIEMAGGSELAHARGVAALYFAMEEIRCHSEAAESIKNRAYEECEKLRDPVVPVLRTRVEEMWNRALAKKG